MKTARKVLMLILCAALLVSATVMGTLAYLTDKSGEVSNTFTVGNIAITLVEHAYNPKDTDAKLDNTVKNTNDYPLIPGTTYFKDPVVTVTAGSENCYLFVKFDEVNNPSTYLTYDSLLDGNGWNKLTEVEGVNNVWYREVTKSDKDQSWHLLAGDKVSVNTNVVKAGTATTDTVAMPAANAQPQLKYTAYAVQKDNLTVTAAWAEVAK